MDPRFLEEATVNKRFKAGMISYEQASRQIRAIWAPNRNRTQQQPIGEVVFSSYMRTYDPRHPPLADRCACGCRQLVPGEPLAVITDLVDTTKGKPYVLDCPNLPQQAVSRLPKKLQACRVRKSLG